MFFIYGKKHVFIIIPKKWPQKDNGGTSSEAMTSNSSENLWGIGGTCFQKQKIKINLNINIKLKF